MSDPRTPTPSQSASTARFAKPADARETESPTSTAAGGAPASGAPATGTTTAVPAATGREGTDDHTRADEHDRAAEAMVAEHERAEEVRREQFGGYNLGADFFGWLVAIALSVLLASIVGAVVTAVSVNLQVDQTQAERQAGTIGIATAVALLVILMVGYYAGGYVAGRMSRYDGARQGFGAWLIGLLVTIVAVALGAVFGSQYNILDRVDLPSIPIPRDTLTGGGIVAAVAILVGTLLAAIVGGKVGQRYHRKVDRAGF